MNQIKFAQQPKDNGKLNWLHFGGISHLPKLDVSLGHSVLNEIETVSRRCDAAAEEG